MSRRKKFAFITWIGPSVSPLKKAKVSTDKAFVKKIVTVSYWNYYMHTATYNIILTVDPDASLSLSLSLPPVGLW